MSLNIEDQSVPYAHSPAGTPQQDNAENVVLVSHSNDRAPLQEDRQQVMLEVIDASSTGERLGLDLVAVLDVSGSMSNDRRLDKLKTAMQFVIKKLSPIDRLSVVIFSNHAQRLCHLRSVTEASQTHLKALVDGLRADGATNIRDGLETGLKVLADRRITGGRVASVFLLSDGDENEGLDKVVDVSHVAVYTFGFGANYDPEVLDEIARKSKGGTFSYVEDGKNMSEPFSQILGGLLSVVVQDLKLTVSPQPGDSTVEKVDSGLYLPARDAGSGSVTVSFGDLFAREVRKVIIHILLPAVNRRKTAIAIVAHCSYSIQGKPFFSRKLTVTIRRIGTGSAGSSSMVPEPVRTEQARRLLIVYLDKACALADGDDMDGAEKKLVEAKNDLNLEQQSNSNPIIDILRATLDKLLELIRLPGFRPYLRSLRTSHDRERVGAPTGDVKGAGLFDTPLTRKFLGQAQDFEKRPTMELPPVEHDFKEEEEEQADKRLTERPPAVVGARTWWGDDRTRSRRAWAMVILCAALLLGISVVAAVAVLAVYSHNRTPYMSVSDAQLGALQYAAQDGTIQYLQLSITILANNVKSKADASFSQVDLALQLHGVDVALLRSPAFVVPPQSSMPLQYDVVSSGRALGPAGMRSMEESLDAGVVPLDLHGKVRTRWKGGGVFHRAHFWTRISCRLRFFFPGNGTVMPADRRRCRSRSP